MELDSLGIARGRATTIETERLRLVPLRREDAASMVVVLADERLHEFVGGRPATLRELQAHYARLAAGSGNTDEIWLNWIVRRIDGSDPIGTVQATVRRCEHGCRASVAWVIGTNWQRQGYASEAATALVGWLKDEGVEDVVAHIRPEHEASARVAARAGLEATAGYVDGERVWRLKNEGASRRPRK